MRTTIDLPEDLFRQMKAQAALRGIPLKKLILRAIESGLPHALAKPVEVKLGHPPLEPWLVEPADEPSRAWSNRELMDILHAEDDDRARHPGR